MTLAEPPESAAEPARDLAGMAGIHRISLPTPFLIGRVNAYLIEDDPLTLVDTGPNSGKSLDELVRALDGLGHSVEALGLIVITHQHMDHLGLLEVLARRSGAEVAAFAGLVPYLENFSASAAADDRFSSELMRRHGVPDEVVTALGGVGAAFRAFGSSGHVTRPLAEGDELQLAGRTLTVGHRPGHSPSDLVFVDQPRRLLIGGDHLLGRISSNPLISRPLGGHSDGERPRALLEYMAPLRATRALDVELVLPGHGEPFGDHRALIDARLRMHGRRADKLLAMLASGPLSAYELACGMWGNVAATQTYLTISEVLGHMDLLITEGRIVEDDADPVTRFVALEER